MSQPQLEDIVAGLLRLEPHQVQAGTSLQALNGSLERVKLGFALQRLGRTLPDNWKPRTFAELAEFVREGKTNGANGAAPLPAARSIAVPSAPAHGGVAIGIDIESVASLPAASDFWEDAFYKQTFTPAEMAYCQLSESPRVRFAAAWCAKEAAKKCFPELLDAPFSDFQLAHESDGRPFLQYLVSSVWQTLPAALTISHTEEMAVAVVVAAKAPSAEPATPVDAPPPAVEARPAPAPPRAGRRNSVLLFAVLVTALIAVWALVRTFPR